MSTPWNPSGQDPQQPGQDPQQPGQDPQQPGQPPQQPGQPGQPGQPPQQPGEQPSYGAPQQPSYGASSQPGQPQQPSYGASSQPGQPQQPSYGQPQQPQQPGQQFGQPQQPGQPAYGPQQPGQPAFGQQPGQPGQPGQPPPFGGGSQPPGYGGYGGAGGPGGQPPKKNSMPIIIGVVVGIAAIIGIFFAIRALTSGGGEDPTGDPTTTQEQTEDPTVETEDPTDETEEPTDEPTDEGGDVVEVADTEVVPGDCILSVDYNENNLWEKVDCSTPHEFEVVAESVTDAADFPGEDVLSGEAEAFCTDAVTPMFDMVGDSESVNFNYMWPTEGTWDAGDRKYSCLMVALDGAMFTGSFLSGDVTVS